MKATRSKTTMTIAKNYPKTPDGRYFLHTDTLWRCTNPSLDPVREKQLVKDLMNARRAIRTLGGGRQRQDRRRSSKKRGKDEGEDQEVCSNDGDGEEAEVEEEKMTDLQRARRAVHLAKVSLGERGPVWWEQRRKNGKRTADALERKERTKRLKVDDDVGEDANVEDESKIDEGEIEEIDLDWNRHKVWNTPYKKWWEDAKVADGGKPTSDTVKKKKSKVVASRAKSDPIFDDATKKGAVRVQPKRGAKK